MFSNTCAMTLAQKSDRILAKTRGLSGATPNATQLIEELRSAFIVRAEFARELEREIKRLTAERDEARRMYCKAVADHYEYACNAELDGAGPYTQKDVAKDEGWDCFKEER